MLTAYRHVFGATLFVLLFGLLLVPSGATAQENVELIVNVDNYSYHSDIWGYSAPDGTELAIIGTGDGTSFIDVTDTNNPSEVLFVPGSSSIWRDIKVYQEYAYIVEDQSGDGLQIVDMSDPLNPFLANTITSYFGTSHNVWLDVPAGFLYCVGTNSGISILDVAANQVNPPEVYVFADPYVHDMHSQNGVGYLGAIYDGTLVTVDVSNLPASMPILDAYTTDDAFCHNTWVTEDDNYCLTTDEVGGGHIGIYDVSDPSNIVKVAEYHHPTDTDAIIHNVSIKGDYAYVAWYKNGLEVIDISVPSAPLRAGFYDTFPGGGGGFDGAWGVYPFADSGNIYVSDMATGLYVFEFSANFGSLQGVISDGFDGDPVVGAMVTAGGKDDITDESGFFKINLDPGNYTMNVTAFGYEDSDLPVSISAGEVTPGDLALTRLPYGEISGFVNDDSRAGIGDALLEIEGTPLSTTTAPDGSYEFDFVPVGSYDMVATAFGFGSTQVGLSVGDGQLVDRDITMNAAIFADDMESNQGWSVGEPNDADTGEWTRVDPNGSGGGSIQPEDDHTIDPGVTAWVTGQAPPGEGIGTNDVDNGRTTLYSPVFDLSSAEDPTARFYRWYVNDGNATVDDVFVIEVSNNGIDWVLVEELSSSRAFWEKLDVRVLDLVTLSSQIQFRFIAADIGSGSIVEAGIDDFEIFDVGDGPTDTPVLPVAFETRLLTAAPNPFSIETGAVLRFELATAQDVSLDIVDVTGRRVTSLVDSRLDAGAHSVDWNGRDTEGRIVPSGIYFQRFRTADRLQSEKLVIVQ